MSARLQVALTVAEGGEAVWHRDEVPVVTWVDLGTFTYLQKTEMKPGEEEREKGSGG